MKLTTPMAGTRVRGWLLVLCVWLLAWQPLTLGLVAAGLLDAIAVDGLPLVAMLFGRLLVAAVGIAAGLALLGRRPGAVTIAKISLVLSALSDVFVYATPYFPSNRMPGDAPLYLLASVLYHGAWLIYLVRSRRVRETFGG